MNKLKILAAALLIAVVAVSCSESGGKSVTLATEIYCDHCQTCETCKPKVEKALTATEGVKSADMDVEKKSITVKYDESKIDEQKIKQVIALQGFPAGDMPADPTAYDNQDDCCKKK